jgi:hypothetical protein
MKNPAGTIAWGLFTLISEVTPRFTMPSEDSLPWLNDTR